MTFSGLSNRKASVALALWLLVPVAGAGIASHAHAGPLKRVMDRMSQTTKAARAELAAFHPANATTLLQAYAQESRDASARVGSASSQSQDLRARFAQLASTADSGTAAATSSAQFRKVFVDIATQCRSCHSVYK